ncbi:hypothetical protein [Dyadobacter sp. CY326]|uniref:hypothetical protein n=1 Tax=Dyadobacter sp. CY326 TaxID=2907300 RepID=UPI001F2D8BCA|nr:hypothetical protein [Dyadobacter sp. CY326]MCE7066460.1 hypothetical protein [Dyadobacter sp. CY326]
MLEIYISYCLKNPISSIAVFITLLPITLILIKKAYIDPSFKLLLFYLIVKLIIDILMFQSAARHRNNIILFNLGIPINYAMLSGMFYFKFSSRVFKRGLIASMIGFLIFTLWDILNSNAEISDLHNHRAVLFAKTVEGVLIITLILLFFYEIIKSLKIPNLLTFPFFWVCSGLLLYYSSFIFIAPVLHYTATWNNLVDLGITETIPTIFEIVCAMFISVGIYHFSARDYAK